MNNGTLALFMSAILWRGGEDYDPCPHTTKKLSMSVNTGTVCVDDDCEDVGFAADGLERTVIDLREVIIAAGKTICCAPSCKKML